jgi:hypothetical protein
MKYFTPELLDRFGSLDDDVADVAHQEWDEASDRYRKQLDENWRVLPVDFRKLLEETPLHDARSLLLGLFPEQGRDLFQIELTPERTVKKLVLTYILAAGTVPRISQARQSPTNGTANSAGTRYWLYDEVDVVRRSAPCVFSHAILFSDGTELDLQFTGFALASVFQEQA